MYLYDETADGEDLKMWEWPRVQPSGDFFKANGFCEDGLPAVNASIPQGEYYIAFGGPHCANMYVNLSTGLISGCGKVALVPCGHMCQHGTRRVLGPPVGCSTPP